MSGAKTFLYSPYPLPWRKKTSGLNDDFKKKAWLQLNNNSKQAYYEFTEYNGLKVLRYAVADIMRPTCLNCHNSHPQSPKKDWKLFDVRGVLEIIHPMENILQKTKSGTQGIYLFATAITVLVYLQ